MNHFFDRSVETSVASSPWRNYSPCFHLKYCQADLTGIKTPISVSPLCSYWINLAIALTGNLTRSLTREDSSSAGIRLIWSGEVTVERVVRGVRGEGKVSHALQPLGGGLGICTPERWQHSSAFVIQASKSFSLSQSDAKQDTGKEREILTHGSIKVNENFIYYEYKIIRYGKRVWLTIQKKKLRG